MKTYIIFLQVNKFSNARKIAEDIQNMNFNSSELVLEEIRKHEPCDNVGICEMNDFMDLCNNQEVNLDKYFISYVNIG